MTHSRPTVRELLDRHGLAPRRDLGQNFVVDPNTVRRIATLARLTPHDHVVEIGAGLGSLTLALAETGAHITAVEVDRGVVPVLRDVVAHHERVRVVEADAMTLDWHELLGDRAGWVLVANLPYNVGTPLVCDVLDHVPAVTRLLVMVQREVAERFVAGPGSKSYGAVSVKVAYHGRARIVGDVPASVFVPRPNVESALVEIVRHDPVDDRDRDRDDARRPTRPTVADPDALFALVRAGFGQRRKMLRRSLSGIVTPEQFAAAGVAADQRPEELDLAAWCRLTDAVHPAGQGSG